MLTRSNFSSPEWYTLQTVIIGTIKYVSMSSPHFYGDLKESIIAKQSLKEFAKTNNSNFIDELADFNNHKSVIPEHKDDDARSLEAPLMSKLSESIEIIKKRDPAMATLFKNLILKLAYDVARGRIKISNEENQAIRKIAIALETPPFKNKRWSPDKPLN